MSIKALTTRPCSLCGLADEVDLGKEKNGKYCYWYGLYISPTDINDKASTVRTACVNDGDHFVWKTVSVAPPQVFEWKKQHTEWSRYRIVTQITIYISICSLVVATASMVLTTI